MQRPSFAFIALAPGPVSFYAAVFVKPTGQWWEMESQQRRFVTLIPLFFALFEANYASNLHPIYPVFPPLDINTR